MNFLRVAGISKKISGSFALSGISFDQHRRQRLAVAGETGSGKSTLLKIIAGLVQPDEGQVYFEDRRVKGPDEQLLPGHPQIAYLSQHYELRNHYRVEELLDMANRLTDREAAAIYRICRIDHLLQRRTDQLSGGERQRIALARLLTARPALLVLDEPFSNLDPIHKDILKTVLEEVGAQLQLSILLASHDPADTLSWADELVVLKEGRIMQQGPPRQLYDQPETAYVAGLFGPYNIVKRERIFALFSVIIDKPAGKELLIRPENFIVETGDAGKGAPATVHSARFLGSCTALELTLGGLTIRAVSTLRGLEAGNQVFVRLNPDRIWFIDMPDTGK